MTQNLGTEPTQQGTLDFSSINVLGLAAIPFFNVKQYGAKGDGVTDDTAAINNALTAVKNVARGTLYFPQGTYCISSTLNIGDGSSAGGRSSYAINLIGEGAGSIEYPGGTLPCSRFKWIGAAGGTMAFLNGPMDGVRWSGLCFDGNNVAANGVIYVNPRYSRFESIVIIGCTNIHEMHTCWSSNADGSPGMTGNTFVNCSCGSADGAAVNCLGLVMGGDPNNLNSLSSTTSGTSFFDTFINYTARFDNSAGSVALDLRVCDTITFIGGAFVGNGAAVRMSQNPHNAPLPQAVTMLGTQIQSPAGNSTLFVTNGIFTESGGELQPVTCIFTGNNQDAQPDATSAPWAAGVGAAGQFWGQTFPANVPLRMSNRVGSTITAADNNYHTFSGSYTLPAGMLNAFAQLIRVKCVGRITTGASTGGLHIQVLLGSTVIWDGGLQPLATGQSNAPFKLDLEGVVFGTGSSGNLDIAGSKQQYAAGTSSNETFLNTGSAGQSPNFDLTQALALTVQAAWGAGNTSTNSVTLDYCTVELESPGTRI